MKQIFGLRVRFTYLYILALLAVMASSANAETTYPFYGSSPSSVGSDGASINLNDYQTDFISLVAVFAEAHGFEPEPNGQTTVPLYYDNNGNPVYPDPRVDAQISVGLAQFSYSEGGGDRADGSIEAHNIQRNGSGHWIAERVVVRGSSTYYNVDLGTGPLELYAAAYFNGIGDSSIGGEVTY